MTRNDFLLLVVSIAVFVIVVMVFDQTRTPIAESAYQPNFQNKNTNMSIQKLAFGAGCFWGTEKFFKKQFTSALNTTKVGYMGGSTKNPSYEQVCNGNTGHAEVLYIEYFPDKVKAEDLVEYFFRMHDPTTLNRQGNDRGTQYRSAIFYYTEEQKQIAEKVKSEVQSKVQGNIVTEITPASEFYVGEDYHQGYLDKNPNGYCNHRLRW